MPGGPPLPPGAPASFLLPRPLPRAVLPLIPSTCILTPSHILEVSERLRQKLGQPGAVFLAQIFGQAREGLQESLARQLDYLFASVRQPDQHHAAVVGVALL